MGGNEYRTGGDRTDYPPGPGFFGREFVELGTLLFAAGAAHLLVLSVGHSDYGARSLMALGALLLFVSAVHRWFRYRAATPRPPHRTGAEREEGGAERLWRLRVGMADLPGGLAALTAAIARLGVDIRFVQIHPGDSEVIDEFYVTAPAGVSADRLRAAVRSAGGRDPAVEPADVHELSDTTSRTLSLVSGMAAGTVPLERALTALSRAREVRREAAPQDGSEIEGLSGTTMTVPAPEGGIFVLRRDGFPFTAVEFARCRALAQVAAAIAVRPGR